MSRNGFWFLGFDIRRHVHRQGSGKLFITPGKEQVKRLRKRLTAEMRALRGANAATVIARLAPIIRGSSAWYRSVVSGRVFTGLDHHVWHITYRWARHTHPKKPRGWVTARYFGAYCKSRQDRWVSGDRHTGAYLTKFSWTKIVRHVPVHGGHPPMTPPWPGTGLTGGASGSRRQRTRMLSGSGEPRTAAVPPAANPSCPPTASHAARVSGSSGSPQHGRCCASSTSPCKQAARTG